MPMAIMAVRWMSLEFQKKVKKQEFLNTFP